MTFETVCDINAYYFFLFHSSWCICRFCAMQTNVHMHATHSQFPVFWVIIKIWSARQHCCCCCNCTMTATTIGSISRMLLPNVHCTRQTGPQHSSLFAVHLHYLLFKWWNNVSEWQCAYDICMWECDIEQAYRFNTGHTDQISLQNTRKSPPH